MVDSLTLLCVLGGAALVVTAAIVLDSESAMSLIADRIAAMRLLIQKLIGVNQAAQATIASLQATLTQRDETIAQLQAEIADNAATAADYAALDDVTAQIIEQINADPAVPTQVIAELLAIRDEIDGIEIPDKTSTPTRTPTPAGDASYARPHE